MSKVTLNTTNYYDLESELGRHVSPMVMMAFPVEIELVRGPDQQSTLHFTPA